MSDKTWPLVCDRCGATELPYGVCSSCGWRCPARLDLDAKLRKSGVPKITKALAEYGTKTKPVNVVRSQSGEVLRADFKCPECKGRGWTLNACDSCMLCLGHGTISGIRRALYRQGKR